MSQKPKVPKGKSLYSVHPAVAYTQAIIANLPATTGKSLEEWLGLVKQSAVIGEKQRREWLKREHRLGGTKAALIAECAEGMPNESTDPEVYLRNAVAYVEAMYAGPKAALRPIHDALIQLGTGLGTDVKVCPCKTIVPLYREHVFAEIKPATRKRIDFGLALRGTRKTPPRRLLDTGGLQKGDRITHRIPIASVDEIDAEVHTWAQIAYDLDAPEEQPLTR
jgi:hypothetical protein